MRHAGGCQCGAIQYEPDREPVQIVACRRTDYLRQSGSAFRLTLIVKAEDFTITQGELNFYLHIECFQLKRCQPIVLSPGRWSGLARTPEVDNVDGNETNAMCAPMFHSRSAAGVQYDDLRSSWHLISGYDHRR